MRTCSIIVILSVLFPGCGPKIVGFLGESTVTDSDASDTSPGPIDEGTSGGATTTNPGATTTSASTTTSAGATTTSEGATTTSEGATTTSTSTTGGEDSDGPVVPAECLAIDHETCFDAAIAACDGNGNWDVTQACIDAVQACYPIATQVLAPADVIEACHAELSGCQNQNDPWCGETFCTCTMGAYPYDWNNCWHLLLLACSFGAVSDCEAVLAGCYPTATVGEYEQCRQEVIEDVGPEAECNCPMCDYHEQCEDALDTCLGA